MRLSNSTFAPVFFYHHLFHSVCLNWMTVWMCLFGCLSDCLTGCRCKWKFWVYLTACLDGWLAPFGGLNGSLRFCLSVWMVVCLSDCLSWLSVCLSDNQDIQSDCLPAFLAACLSSVCLPACPLVCLPVCLSVSDRPVNYYGSWKQADDLFQI